MIIYFIYWHRRLGSRLFYHCLPGSRKTRHIFKRESKIFPIEFKSLEIDAHTCHMRQLQREKKDKNDVLVQGASKDAPLNLPTIHKGWNRYLIFWKKKDPFQIEQKNPHFQWKHLIILKNIKTIAVFWGGNRGQSQENEINSCS